MPSRAAAAEPPYATLSPTRAHARSERPARLVTRRLPLLVFLGAYLFSCYVGALALLFSVRFRTLFFIFSGAQPVDLSWRDLTAILTLLHLGPLALWAGYELALRLAAPLRRWRIDQAAPARAVPWIAFALSAGVAAWSIGRVGGVETAVAGWLDYNAYVQQRWHWFASLGFAEFVNLYTVLPLSATALVLTERRWPVLAAALAVVLALQYPLAIRKVLLTSLLLMACAALVYWTFGNRARWPLSARRQGVAFLAVPVALYVVYVGLTLTTVLGSGSQAFQNLRPDSPQVRQARARRSADRDRMRAARGADGLAIETGLTDEDLARLLQHRTTSVVLYTLLAPLTRTSICAVVYPVIFPRWQAYYPPDVGLDILGWGRMPDDNLVVYRYLWPEHEHGSVAAPFHVVLYSQGGVSIAIAGALLTGMLLAAAWSLVPLDARPGVTSSLLGALVLTLAMFLAIDSLRNSLVVSYGLLWGAGLVAALELAGRATGRRRTDAVPVTT